jgi:ceramide glucosyltransferase
MILAAALVLYILLRLFKLACIVDFFRKPPPPEPENYPTVSLIQPITAGAANIEDNLLSRLSSDYLAHLQHIWLCDESDAFHIALCRKLAAAHPDADIEIIELESKTGMASKVEKIHAGAKLTQAEVFCFIDDDIELQPTTIKDLIIYLLQPNVGATFGLASATSANTIWTKLNTLLVNSQGLPTYIPITYFTEPFTITGHLFAIPREAFELAGSFNEMENRLDDDHAIAQRLRAKGLRCVQTPMIYRVHNEFATFRDYLNQLKRWFIFPRQFIIPAASPYERFLSSILSFDVFVPPFALLLLIVFPSQIAVISFLSMLAFALAIEQFVAMRYLKINPSFAQLLLAPFVIVFVPCYILFILSFGNKSVVWRGQRLRLKHRGYFEVEL